MSQLITLISLIALFVVIIIVVVMTVLEGFVMSMPWFAWVFIVAIICGFKYLLKIRADKKEARQSQNKLYHTNFMNKAGDDCYKEAVKSVEDKQLKEAKKNGKVIDVKNPKDYFKILK